MFQNSYLDVEKIYPVLFLHLLFFKGRQYGTRTLYSGVKWFPGLSAGGGGTITLVFLCRDSCGFQVDSLSYTKKSRVISLPQTHRPQPTHKLNIFLRGLHDFSLLTCIAGQTFFVNAHSLNFGQAHGTSVPTESQALHSTVGDIQGRKRTSKCLLAKCSSSHTHVQYSKARYRTRKFNV